MIAFRVRHDYAKGYQKTLTNISGLLRDFRWAWPHVNHAVELHHARVFDTEGAASRHSGPWKALAPFTVKARLLRLEVTKGHPNDYAANPVGESAHRRILHWTHTLRRSFTQRGAAGAVREFTRKSYTYGSSVRHARKHQDGGKTQRGLRRGIPGGRLLPKRPPLDVVGGPAIALSTLRVAMQRRFRLAGAA